MARPLDEVEQVAFETIMGSLVALLERRAGPIAQLVEPMHDIARALDVIEQRERSALVEGAG